MNRAMFLSELRMGLSGLPQSEIEETIADYEAHFSEGLAAGRSEAAIANAWAIPPGWRANCAPKRVSAAGKANAAPAAWSAR